jgi:hypothetical protein
MSNPGLLSLLLVAFEFAGMYKIGKVATDAAQNIYHGSLIVQ